MNTPKCPSKAPRLLGLFLIIFVAPAIFVLGFGANKKHQAKPQKAAVTTIFSKENAVVPTTKGETVFIYADAYTVYRNDAVFKVEDTDGNEIPTTALLNQKSIPYEGQTMAEFSPVASFTPSGESVRVYCDLTSNTRGEFLVGAKMSRNGISIFMLLFFALGCLIMGIGLAIAVKNVYARKKWFEEHGRM